MKNTCNQFKAEQELARTHRKGPALVLAGPGSGKTRVITGRLAYLIGDSAVPPSSILTITFTKAAAEEMKQRSMNMIGSSASSVNFATFHSLFLSILRHTYRFGPENIINSRTQFEISKEIIESENIEIRESDRFYSDLLNDVSRFKTFHNKSGEFNSSALDDDSFKRFFKRYTDRMNNLRLIDFDDMIIRANHLFKERESVRQSWADKFEYIMIDEFQDIDPLQYETVKMLCGEESNIFVVGDDDQSIYGFRGADPSIMRSFLEDHPTAKLIRLSKNYRSDPHIVESASIVINENKERLPKNIISAASFSDAGSVEIREFTGHYDEIEALKEELLKDSGNFKGKAIITRTNAQSSFFASELSIRDIPVICREKLSDIYDHFIAKDIFTYLELARGSKRRADIYRIMNRPCRYISRNSVPASKFDFEYMKKFHRENLKTFSAISKLENDLRLISKMRPYVAIHYILHGIGYLEFLKDHAVQKKIDLTALEEKASEISAKAKACRDFAEWKKSAEEHRRKIEEINSKKNKESQDDKNAVNIMTMHSSKGLEFDEVFLPDVNEKIIPYHKAVLPAETEEERRLFYVAMTRAKKKLHIWYIKDNFGKAMAPSHFIDKLNDKQNE